MKTNKILYQWDAGQKLTDCRGVFVDFVISGEVYRCDVVNGECIVPDELLQHPGNQTAYECMADNTLQEFVFSVVPRPLPPDYVYTPTEKLTFEGLVQKVEDTVADIIRRADTGEFDGYTPVKGKDYFTESEKNEMMQRVSDGAIGEFREVVDSATAGFNANAEKKVGIYDSNSAEKLKAYNDNHTEKMTAYDTNATDKLSTYNRNAAEKLEAYNSNHAAKVAEYNQNAAALQTEVDRLRGECDTLAAENRKQESRIDALIKLNKGQTYDVIEQESEAYSVDVPSGSHYASVDMVGGKSVVWNQLVDGSNLPTTRTINGITVTNNGDGSITVDGTATENADLNLQRMDNKTIIGHKYLILGGAAGGSISTYFYRYDSNGGTQAYDYGNGAIFTKSAEAITYITIRVLSGVTVSGLTFKPQLVDLTAMFGAGNEPSTVEEFEEMFPDDYYPYSEPTIISSQTDRVDVKSSNLIYPNMPFVDRSGYTSNGVTYTYDENRVITINGTRAENVSGSLGLFSYGALSNGKYTLSVYDEHGNYARDVNINVNVTPPYTFIVDDSNRNSIITILASISGKKYNNAKYYIKLEKGAKSTPYNPYIMQQITTNFPALNSAGSVYDYIDLNEGKLHQRVGIVDLGTIDWEQGGANNRTSWVPVSWKTNVKPAEGYDIKANILCSKYKVDISKNVERQIYDKTISVNDNALVYIYDSAYISATPQEFKAAMNGVMLYYELAEEVITDIEIPTELTDWLTVEAGGSVTFNNSDESKQLAVPNSVSWVRKLDEVE